jgi:hypothetical protein
MPDCSFCGQVILNDEPRRMIPVGDHNEPMHDEPRLCATRYEFSMLAARLDSALRKGTIEHPPAAIKRVEFNRTFSGGLLMLLQKWDRNAVAQATFETVRALAQKASDAGADAIVSAFGSVADMNDAAYAAERDRRAASDDLERAVMVASDTLYDAVFGQEAE